MFRTCWIGVSSVAVLIVAISAGQARAQTAGPRVGSPPPGPTVSPYLNLLRAGNSPAANYYGLVRPQLQTDAGIQSLQQQFLTAQARPLPGQEPVDDLLVTGHAAVFMNYGGFFQSPTGGLPAGRPQGLLGFQPLPSNSRQPVGRR
jgi:hypothetical protein